MDYVKWEPIYKEILKEFGFDQKKDDEAAQILSNMIQEDKVTDLFNLLEEKDVIICGGAPSLQDELKEIKDEVVLAADGATSVLINNGIIADVIVTDLDGIVGDLLYSNRLGSFMVVHAHGDNIKMLKKVVPELTNVLGTTQSEPFDNIHNFGGFTDGDRCVFIAKNFNVRTIKLIGFDFDDQNVGEIKKKKLNWAHKLISKLLF